MIRKRSSSPKFQVHNNALLAAQHPDHFAEIKNKPSEWGRVVESAVGAYFKNLSMTHGISVYYWRERDKEVDYILEYKNRLLAIEVKSNDGSIQKGLGEFRNLYPDTKIMLVGKHLSWQELLKSDPVDLF